MNHRIEISPLPKWRDARGEGVKKQTINFLNIEIEQVLSRDVYTISGNIDNNEAEKISQLLYNPVLQGFAVNGKKSENYVDLKTPKFIVVIGFKPGVTDNVGRSAKAAIGDILGRKLSDNEYVFSSVEYLLYGDNLDLTQANKIAFDLLGNNLIHSISVLDGETKEIQLNLPIIEGGVSGEVKEYNLEVSDAELLEISRKGTLALTLDEMKVVQNYFRNAINRDNFGLNANPTDVELEVLAQTWSEHCKHKIFDAIVDYENCETGEKEQIVSLYKSFIKKSTYEIAEEVDWLVSVFHDNAGVISFNEKLDLVYKVETHNSPSALDPYGGAMTGIVGVNRDPMGTGQGAELLINAWGYCLGSPFTENKDVPESLLHPRRLRDGIHKGVIDGGNQSGIPYGLGWEYFEERYLGKPLVYCGTVGTLPKQIGEVKGFDKTILPGDLIVMGGGRIGKDGIHGATFSSEELHKDSPVQAVQIGDPITQKKLGDFIYEARDRGLYRFITDNGAGGLSSSVGEMASCCDGCVMDLSLAPLKYAGLSPWEILVSEAQERMSFAVPPENIEEFKKLAIERDVEVTVMGKFTDDGKFRMTWGDKTVASLDIEFMHKGLPRLKLNAVWNKPKFAEPDLSKRNLNDDLVSMLGRLNICSLEYKARQYDHEVKGLSVIKPFVGKNRDVMSDATVTMIEQLSSEGVILASGILPRYSDIDTYWMTASVIDVAIRKIIAVGGKLGLIAGLDNYCWPDPVQSAKTPDGEYKMAQLVRSNQALYEFTKAFQVPCISGKDSMKNDSTRGGKKISIPPSLLFSTISKMDDISKAVTLDFKKAGDVIYVIGETKKELGGSEYFYMLNATGNKVPTVDAKYAINIYNKVSNATEAEVVKSLQTPVLGGLAVAFAKGAVAGCLGAEIDLNAIVLSEKMSSLEVLFSESNSRFVATIAPENVEKFEALLGDIPFAKVGIVNSSNKLSIKSIEGDIVDFELDNLRKSYKSTLNQI